MRAPPNTLRYRLVDVMGNGEVVSMVERAASTRLIEAGADPRDRHQGTASEPIATWATW